jgi:hypothetical protein
LASVHLWIILLGLSTANRGVSRTFSPLMYTKGSFSPSRTEISYGGRSYLGELVGSPASAPWCFSWRPSIVAPACWETTSPCGGRVVRGGDEGGRDAPPFHFPLTRGPKSRGVSTPLPFCHLSNGTQISLCAHISKTEACFSSRFAVSSGELASHGSPRPPPRPYISSRAQ